MKFLSLLLVLSICVLISLKVNAGVISYRMDYFGNITGSTPVSRFYELDDDRESYVVIDDYNNTLSMRNTGGISTINLRNLHYNILASDILDITFADYNSFWFTTEDASYRMDYFGNFTGSTPVNRFYELDDDRESYVVIDDYNNTLSMRNTGGIGTINLNNPQYNFLASDILDITFADYNSFWFTTEDVSYRMDYFGNITGITPVNRFYELDDDRESYVVIDDYNNTLSMRNTGGIGTINLNNPQYNFLASDILDITFADYNAFWFTVNEPEQNDSVVEAPEPSSLTIFSVALLGLLNFRKYKNK